MFDGVAGWWYAETMRLRVRCPSCWGNRPEKISLQAAWLAVSQALLEIWVDISRCYSCLGHVAPCILGVYWRLSILREGCNGSMVIMLAKSERVYISVPVLLLLSKSLEQYDDLEGVSFRKACKVGTKVSLYSDLQRSTVHL